MDEEAELDITEELKLAFSNSLTAAGVSPIFISGAWSSSFVGLLYERLPPLDRQLHGSTVIMAAETIYSPFALQSFAATLDEVLRREQHERGSDGSNSAAAVVAAKKLYFGVGGSLDDFIITMTALSYHVETLREATDGVHRGVVLCRPTFPS
jgi:protein-histidine N-methyltransferase